MKKILAINYFPTTKEYEIVYRRTEAQRANKENCKTRTCKTATKSMKDFMKNSPDIRKNEYATIYFAM